MDDIVWQTDEDRVRIQREQAAYAARKALDPIPLVATELAWAAGFFEGEGSVSISRCPTCATERLRLNVSQIGDTYPLERFVTALGMGHVTGPHLRAGKRDRYAVDLSGTKSFDAMELLRPYLGGQSKKLRKYDEALERGVSSAKSNGWDTGARRRSRAA